ncbi:diguanylate cyclase [Actinoplanes sp. NPDC049802]|uniref:diguanylate cyclase n=1 Tax=Actinoplanes sp. NPDC049802 TaxID=3154742 RepID=UPI0033C827D0
MNQTGPAVPGLSALEPIGRGAHSVVYRAERSDGTPVAVKVLLDPAGRAALRREATWTATCGNGLPEVYHTGEADGLPYAVMEFVAGDCLADLLAAGPRDAATTARIGADVATTLAALHRLNLAHRDVKPENVIIAPDGRARLVDLGLTKRAGGHAGDEVAGTLTYASPEQNGTLQRPVDARSDLYALGAVLHECLSGRPPFQAADAGELIRLHAVAVAPVLPGPLGTVIARLLAKDPDDRYAGAPAVAAILRAVAAGGPVPEVADEPVRPIETPFAGRAAETAALTAEWALVREGARSAVIRGGAGLGKTRLLREFTAGVRAAGVPVLRATCRPGDAPLAVLARAVDSHLKWIARHADAAATARIRDAAGTAAPYLSRLSPGLREVLGAAAATGDAYPRAVAAFLAELAARSGGAILAFDDAHWLDDATAQVTQRILARHAGEPLLILTATAASGAGAPGVRAIDLKPLDRAAVAQLIEPYSGGYPLAGGLFDRLLAGGGGLPLGILTLMRVAVDNGLVAPRDGRLDLDGDGLAFVDIPTDLEGLLLSRIADLGPAGRDLLTAAAVAGFQFDPASAARVAGTDEGEARAGFDTAAGLGVLEPVGGGFAFVHERMHRALLGALSAGRLRDLHQRAADVVAGPARELARHLLDGHPERDPARTVAACLAAARAALDDHAGQDAVVFLEAAERFRDRVDAATAAALDTSLGAAYAQAGRPTEAGHRFRAALAAGPDRRTRARLHEQLAQLELTRWHVGAALDEVDRGLAALGDTAVTAGARGLAGTLGHLLAAVAIERTGIGFGTADPERLARFRQRFALHAIGSYAGILTTNPAMLAGHEMRSRYTAARIGMSPEYARQVVHRAALKQTITRRPARREFARAYRLAATVGDPAVIVHAEYMRRLAEIQTGEPDLPEFSRWLRRHSALLNTTENLSYALSVGSRWFLRGRMGEMRASVAQGVGSLDHEDQHRVPVARLHGDRRISGAADVVTPPADQSRGQDTVARLMMLSAVLDQALQDHEFGETFDRAAAELAALRIRPIALPSTMRTVFLTVAYGRVEQLRTAAPGLRAAPLAEARRALRQLRTASFSGRGACRQLAAHHAVLKAHVDWLGADGDRARRRAVRSLAAVDRRTRDDDVPVVTASAALLRARDAARSGHTEEAVTFAEAAAGLADRIGMLQFAHAVRREFALTASDTARRAASGDGGAADRRRLAALERLSRTVSGMVNLDALSRAVLDETVRILNAERAYLFLLDDAGRLQPHSGRDAGGQDLEVLTDYGSTIVDRVRRTGEPVVVTGAEEGAALGSRSVVLHGLRSIMAAPLILDGRLLGVVYLDSRVAKGMFTAADAGILAAVTQHVAAAVETARAAQLAVAVRAAEQQRDMADTLRESMIRFSRSLEPEAVLEELRATLARVLPAARSHLVRASGDGDLTLDGTVAVERTAALNALLAAPGPVPVDGLPAITPDAGCLVVPLHRPDTPVGLVVLTAEGPGAYGPTEVKLAAALAEEAMVAYDNAVLFAQVRYLATTDPLTGISNRRHFFGLAGDTHAAAHRAGAPFVAVMADIDHFKQINDRYGHQAGDQVIATVAARLREALPEGGRLGRYGGEEFAAVWICDGAPEAAAERLRRAVTGRPVETGAGTLAVTVSVGVFAAPATGTGPEAALGAADGALYAAKEAGRNRVAVAAGHRGIARNHPSRSAGSGPRRGSAGGSSPVTGA